jgi:hypothetical protein
MVDVDAPVTTNPLAEPATVLHVFACVERNSGNPSRDRVLVTTEKALPGGLSSSPGLGHRFLAITHGIATQVEFDRGIYAGQGIPENMMRAQQRTRRMGLNNHGRSP